jgi:hypothetical protein
MVVQVVLPILYFSIRFSQIQASRGHILRTIGVEGLAGVPWAARDVTLTEKVEGFFGNLIELERLNNIERSMSAFNFALSAVQLLRLIVQTSGRTDNE